MKIHERLSKGNSSTRKTRRELPTVWDRQTNHRNSTVGRYSVWQPTVMGPVRYSHPATWH
eukprot:1178947-Prorocentrum_minimum.AAC.10